MNEQVRLSRSSSSCTKATSGCAVITTLVDRAACKNVKHALTRCKVHVELNTFHIGSEISYHERNLRKNLQCECIIYAF